MLARCRGPYWPVNEIIALLRQKCDVAVYQSDLKSLPLLGRGKVRDNYAVGEDKLLILTTDRLSAFDVIMQEPIPDKGKVLNQMALYWFEALGDIVPNHLTGIAPEVVVSSGDMAQVAGRSMVVKRLRPIMVEAVVRGYLIGSGWKDYQDSGAVCGIKLPAGLQMAQKLPEPIFTPAAKAEMGEHDENISFDDMCARIGKDLAETIRTISIKLYLKASALAAEKGIIIADTKFEFGLDEAGVLHLMDEVLTADSSRFWPAFDKQFVRDYLETVTTWKKTAPAPKLPADVIAKTSDKYKEALKRITGHGLDGAPA
jgi:phosphoribosylaminoimidazole-succinocarboxamide synthase